MLILLNEAGECNKVLFGRSLSVFLIIGIFNTVIIPQG